MPAPLAMATLAVGALLTAPAAHGQSAATMSKRGAVAEAREDYETAFVDYKAAHDKKPADLRYLAHFERMRFLAATQQIERGRLLRQNGDYTGAIQRFMRAAQIDPSNQAAQQEIQRTQRDEPAPGPSSPTGAAAAGEQMSEQNRILTAIGTLAGPIQLRPVSNDPIMLHMVEDVKNIYQAIGKLAGLNVLFDPDYTAKRIPVDLTNVTLADALRIVGTISGTFYKPVTSNTIFVAQNTRSKRTDLDELSIQTFYLSNSSQANDGNEILTALRQMLDPTVKLYLMPSQNAIVVRGTTDELLLAEKLINDFDRAKAEVVIDVAVLEVNRDKMRNLGITLPTSIGLTPQIANTTSSTTTGTTTSSANTGSNLNLNQLTHLNANNFGVTVSGGTVNALLSDADTRVLQNPRIRATDNQRATLKIGQKIPVATGSFNSGASAGGLGGFGTQTNFTYLDVGVNIDITPTVHYDREISLKTKVEVSQQNGQVTLQGGVVEPIIAQRVLDQVIQLKDGEPSILAGIVTKLDNKSVMGTPGLAELPFFKFFFSSQDREVQTDEIVFLMIPHIVRESVLTRLNTGIVDTGTSQEVELRTIDKAQMEAELGPVQPPQGPGLGASTTTAANAASSALAELNRQAQPVQPPTAAGLPASAISGGTSAANTAPAASAFGGAPVSMSISPVSSNQTVGATFQATVSMRDAKDISSVPIQIQFDPHILALVNVDAGDFLAQGGQNVSVAHRVESNGQLIVQASRPPNTLGVSGQGNVCVLTFKAIAAGDTNLTFAKVGAKNSSQTAVAATGASAVVHVK